MEHLKLTRLDKGREDMLYAKPKLKELLMALSEMHVTLGQLATRGVDGEGILRHYVSQKGSRKWPKFQVRHEGVARFAFTADELNALVSGSAAPAKKASSAKKGKGAKKGEAPQAEAVPKTALSTTIEITTEALIGLLEGLGDLVKKLESIGLRWERDAKGQPMYLVEEGDARFPVEDALGVFPTIKVAAKKGLNIQRYKGLGEMNPHQLYETTMDRTRRTLMKVELEDTVEADRMFTILMGDEVEPRREFIETNALHVRNLDI